MKRLKHTISITVFAFLIAAAPIVIGQCLDSCYGNPSTASGGACFYATMSCFACATEPGQTVQCNEYPCIAECAVFDSTGAIVSSSFTICIPPGQFPSLEGC
jgi:hypothetical protein